MTIELSGKMKLLTVRMEGEIDHFKAAKIREKIEKEIRRTGAVSIAFDFSGVTFSDSSAIGLIIGRYQTVKSLGGKIIIYGLSRQTEKIFKMSGIEKIAEIY